MNKMPDRHDNDTNEYEKWIGFDEEPVEVDVDLIIKEQNET